MDFVQKDNTNTTNLQRVNEVGGAEDTLDKVKNPGDAKSTITGKEGTMSGHEAVQNDFVRYLDFINGKGDYGTAGRDHSFALASLAVVNPAAAGMIVGVIALGAAIHGIATSTFVRKLSARRRLDYIYNEAINDGYNPSRHYVGWFGGFSWGFHRTDPENLYGPQPFERFIGEIIQRLNRDILASGIVDPSTGEYVKRLRDTNQKDNYATASNFIASSVRYAYIPDKIIMSQRDVFKAIQDSRQSYSRWSAAKDYGSLANLQKDATQKVGSAPLIQLAEDQMKFIKSVGDSVCEGFDRKMARPIKNGKYRPSQASAELKNIWNNYLRKINARYTETIDRITSSDYYKTLRRSVETLAKVTDESEIITGLSDALNVGSVFGRRVGNAYQMWKVSDNSMAHDRNATIVLANTDLVGPAPIRRQELKSVLYDRSRFVHYVENRNSTNIHNGGLYRMGLSFLQATGGADVVVAPNDALYVRVIEIMAGHPVTVGTVTTTPLTIFYIIVNFYPAIGVGQVYYDDGDHFQRSIIAEMVEDDTEMNPVQGGQRLRSNTRAGRESAQDIFDPALVLNEDDKTDKPNDGETTVYDFIDDSPNDNVNYKPKDKGTDKEKGRFEEDNEDIPMYEDVSLEEYKDHMFVLPGRYIVRESEGDVLADIKEVKLGEVEYFVGDTKRGSVSFKKWTEMTPLQLPYVEPNETYKVLPPKPRDIANSESDQKYKLPEFPLTYGTFYTEYLRRICDYNPVLEKNKKELSKYGLYLKDGNIGGLYILNGGSDSDFSMHIAYNFAPYIRSLGDTVLFESEESYKNLIKSDDKTHESKSVKFSEWLRLNESAINESTYNGKSFKKVKEEILDALRKTWGHIALKQYDEHQRKKIANSSQREKDEVFKKIDKETIEQIVKEFKIHVLTDVVKGIIGDERYKSFIDRIELIKTDGLKYKQGSKYAVTDFGRTQDNVENIPDFDSVADDLAKLQQEVKSECAKMSDEDRKKARGSAEETTVKNKKDNKDDDSIKITSKQDTDKSDTEKEDDNADNKKDDNGGVNITINVVNNDNAIELVGGKLPDMYKDRDLDKISDGVDPQNTPVDKPENVSNDDSELKNVIMDVCAQIIKRLSDRTKEERKVRDKLTINAIKNKNPEYYIFSKKSKDEIIRTGDESKILLNSDESKKLKQTEEDKQKYIVPVDFILAKATEYNSSDDTFKFLTEEGEYTISGEDTVIKLGFEYAQRKNEDVVSGIMSELGLPTEGTVLDIPEDVLSELTKTNSDQVNDSVWQQYLAATRLYEDGNENNVNYVRVIVYLTDLTKEEVVFKDGNGKEYTVSLKKFKEYGIDKFRSSYKKVSFEKSGLIPDFKYSIDKEYYNSILVEQSAVDASSKNPNPLEKSDDEQIVRIVYVNDNSQRISFKVITSQNKDEQRYLSYLYVDPSKFTKTDKDDEDGNNIEFNKGDVYIITNFNEVRELTLKNKNESLQDYAYYKLYGMYLNEADDTKQKIMKIVKVDGDDITFSLDDKDKETYTLSKSVILSKFKLEKYEGDGDTSASFDPKDYKEQDTQVSYPLDSIKNLASIIAAAKTDEEKKKQLLQFIDNNKQTIMNSGVSSSDNNEILVDLEALAQKFSAETKPEEGKIYNMLYVSASSSVTNSPVQSVIVTCDKITEGNVYFSVKDKDNKFFIPSDKMSAVYLYPMEEKKNESALYESIGVSINKNKYALYRLYGGSLLEAVDINPANPAMLAALVNMLVSANKGLSGQQPQQQSDNQDNTEQNDQQNNQQNAQNAQNQQTQQPQQPQQNNQENTNQKQMSTNVQGVPFTVQTGKPVQMV